MQLKKFFLVIPQACVKLFREKKHKCSHGVKKNWKPHREYVIYNNLEDEKYRRKFGRYGKKKICKNIDCLWAMNMNFNELNLIRSQSRIIEGNLKNKELLLGDIHSRRDSSYKPTAFQVPLIESSHVSITPGKFFYGR